MARDKQLRVQALPEVEGSKLQRELVEEGHDAEARAQ